MCLKSNTFYIQILGVLFAKLNCAFNREQFEVPMHPVSESSTWMLTLHGGVSEWSMAGNYRISFRLWKREVAHRTEDDDENVEKARPEWGKAYEESHEFSPSLFPSPFRSSWQTL